MTNLNSGILTPLYEQLYHTLREQISDGQFPAGAQIPSEEHLSEMYGISRVTVRSAIKRLVEENVLVKKHGKGTFVAMPVFVESVSAGGSFTRSCLQHNAVPSTKLIFGDTVAADRVQSEALGVAEGERILCVKRIRMVDGVAAIFEIDYFRPDYGFMLEADLESTPVSALILSNTGTRAAHFEDVFEVRHAAREQALALDCAKGTPLIRVWQTVMGDDRRVLYCNEQYILSDRYKYAITYSGCR